MRSRGRGAASGQQAANPEDGSLASAAVFGAPDTAARAVDLADSASDAAPRVDAAIVADAATAVGVATADGASGDDTATSADATAADATATQRVSERVSERMAALRSVDLVDRPTRRRAGVFRRALRHEASRLRDRHRLVALLIVGLLGGFILACLLARGEAAGGDARAYWAAARLWVNGGDPYHPTGPFMPYVYAPWLLPVFLPWALLPWTVAWFVWRGVVMLGFLWSFHWAYRQRPLTTALLVVVLALPIAGTLDTGNINLPLALLLFAAQFTGPRVSGFLWAIATSTKWAPAVLWPVLSPRGRLWGIAWLVICALLTLATLPATLMQLRTLFGYPQPPRLDYLVFIWSTVPWFWRHPHAFWWLSPSAWPRVANALMAVTGVWAFHWRRNPDRTAGTARRLVTTRVRTFLGMGET